MAESKFTKGPWRAEEITEHSHSVRIFAGEEFLSVVGIWQRNKGITKANADLMAAAPELLRTIRELVELGGPDQDDQFTREGVRAFRDAEALLEKHGG